MMLIFMYCFVILWSILGGSAWRNVLFIKRAPPLAKHKLKPSIRTTFAVLMGSYRGKQAELRLFSISLFHFVKVFYRIHGYFLATSTSRWREFTAWKVEMYLLPVAPVFSHHFPQRLQYFDAQTLLVLLQQLLGVLDQSGQGRRESGEGAQMGRGANLNGLLNCKNCYLGRFPSCSVALAPETAWT